MTDHDVPSPVDFRQMEDAIAWESEAMDRPFRREFFDAFTHELRKLRKPAPRVLELGSGPGFLALYLLRQLTQCELTLLDYSPAMHELAKRRLGELATGVRFEERDFKTDNWWSGLGSFDAVISIQAVHELRHKRYASTLHEQVHALLHTDGLYMMCDHFYGEGGMENDQLYMSLTEQQESLENAGYFVTGGFIKAGRAFYSAVPVNTKKEADWKETKKEPL